MTTYTKEEKKTYLEGLRNRWSETKKQVDEKKLGEIKAIIQNHGMNVSPYSYYFVALQINRLGWEGIPYLDYKTFKGWESNGFKVKKGEKSQIKGITWVTPYKKDADGNEVEADFTFPKEYYLFGRHQVEAI